MIIYYLATIWFFSLIIFNRIGAIISIAQFLSPTVDLCLSNVTFDHFWWSRSNHTSLIAESRNAHIVQTDDLKKKEKKTSINVDQKFQCQRRAIVTIIPVWERIPISKASRSHLTRTVTYVSRHREIIAINATDGERIFPYLCARIVCHWVIDRRPLSGRQLLRGTTASSSRGKPPGESHKISTALYIFLRVSTIIYRPVSSDLVRPRPR